ncbi:MAG: FAD-dependent thymidylate synthase [Firmicutes bacterium]|nr:FAD-dependent thymidylate synthase [Bacillota bacterium]
MRIIEPSVEIMDKLDGKEIIRKIELAGRVCYKSEGRITEGSAEKFIRNLLKRGHESVLEHEKITVRFICDRGVTHEMVRHRIASYSQESSRYCNYSPDGNQHGIAFIKPCFWTEDQPEYKLWLDAMAACEKAYNDLIAMGAKPEQARDVLPNSLKTEIVMTANLREWRHFLKLRTAPAAHPQIREVAGMLLKQLHQEIPIVFDDIEEETE